MANTPGHVVNGLQGKSGVSRLRILIGLAILAGVFLMALTVDSGLNATWPDWARAAWAFAIVFLILVGVALVATGSGAKTSRQLARSASEEEVRAGRILTGRQFFAVYASTILGVVFGAIWLENHYRIDGPRSIFGLMGILFLLAALKEPWWLFFTFRRLGWFAVIGSELAMRLLLAFLGLGMVVLAILNQVT
jgi:MFS family permease